MAWDSDTQHAFHTAPLQGEAGEISFTTTGTTVAVRTRLSKIYAISLTAQTANDGGVEQLYCDNTITNGTVTVGRVLQSDTGTSAVTPTYTSNLTVSYILLGI